MQRGVTCVNFGAFSVHVVVAWHSKRVGEGVSSCLDAIGATLGPFLAHCSWLPDDDEAVAALFFFFSTLGDLLLEEEEELWEHRSGSAE